ncbi:DnaD domain protein [Metamycoplasma canadense]|uniref:Uncharacterized protein n=1 Tax=Metamycoplasma canadense TaxID=29554 RepID=A0A077L5S8_9BACT|nr:DnaD domain protein [Metamycoplasma canadense]BAP39640.1 hypothetical protein MCAN360_0523 [Metamycoplasma canadense]
MKYLNFYIDNPYDISSKDLINLRKLYSPIIGSLGIAFYHHLYDLHNTNKIKKHDLLETSEFLVLDEEQINKTKEILEGIGLLKTFQDKNGNLIFKLIKPLNANEISNNILVSSILKSKLGENKFNDLINENAIYSYDENNINDVSKNFFDVFGKSIKIETKNDDFDFTIINEDELLNNLSPEKYIHHFTKRELSPTQIFMLKKIKQLNFDNKAINLFIQYSISINNSIVCNYIEKIANDFAKRNLFEANLIDIELSQAINVKRNSCNIKNNWIDKKINNFNNNIDDPLNWDD